ncbi:MAG: bifunctional methylenetetrahydrofolate dehydrogenase/methenyltetrahydrofolate cyclohydrolase, partial [Parcubacteria group bacterium]|nr:bifunctional methylenetetrahydrofolate dehydrogenase/methenyltetrahydrofolate cyclohydrolase [Parcubacteria group bacterium]
PEMLKGNTAVIDFGYSLDENGKIHGDFDNLQSAISNLQFYTPTPGGTGPILVAKLFENFYKLNSS